MRKAGRIRLDLRWEGGGEYCLIRFGAFAVTAGVYSFNSAFSIRLNKLNLMPDQMWRFLERMRSVKNKSWLEGCASG